MRVTLRIIEASTDADLERVLAVRNSMERPLSLAGLRAERSSAVATLDVIAERDGEDVGAGSVAWGPTGASARTAFIFAWVVPEHRRTGIGGALLDRLTAFARSKGIERMATLVYEDEGDAIDFVIRRGLEIDGGGQLGYLDLASAPEIASSPIDGITIVSLADRPDLDEALYQLDILVRPEIPMIAHEPLPDFPTWQAAATLDPGYLPGLTLLALEGDRLVGGIQLYDNAEDVAFIGMISVHPDTRRRGIGRLLKLELTHRAREAGLRAIETYNDGTNERIRGLNESLGYVYDRPYVALRGPLPGPSEPDPRREIQRP